MDISDEHLTRAVQRLQDAVPDLAVVYLFGSAATGTTTAESDVDLAIWADASGEAMDAMTRWNLQNDLARIFRCDVDLVDLRQASVVMRAQVLKTGRVVFEADETVRHRFEMTVLSMYADLNEQRRHILEDVRKRGSIYG